MIFLILIGSFILFKVAFHVNRKETLNTHKIPDTKQHRIFKDRILKMIDATCAIPFEEVETKSFDGLKLYGRLYVQKSDAPFEILFHGYKDNAISDFCGGLRLALSLGHNVILVDQRAHGKSEGKCLSFGILERKDVVSWVNYVKDTFGDDTPVILMGISMGASTVLMASDLEITPNVKGIIADCGYSSPEGIIRKVAGDLKLPLYIVMPLLKLGAKLYGGFGLDDATATDALKNAKVPVLFIHGEEDDFVPYNMGAGNFESCSSEKYMLSVPEAGHGLSFFYDKEGYIKTVKEFTAKVLGG